MLVRAHRPLVPLTIHHASYRMKVRGVRPDAACEDRFVRRVKDQIYNVAMRRGDRIPRALGQAIDSFFVDGTAR